MANQRIGELLGRLPLIGRQSHMAAVTENNTHDTDFDVMRVAIETEDRLHAMIDSFELAGARLYGVNIGDGIESHLVPCYLAQHPDVYELLQAPGSSLARMFHAAAIVTTGWAAPLDTDGRVHGAPSEHSQRRRVRLTVLVANSGIASVLRFADAPDDVVTDPGSATGSLAEAINQFWFDPPVGQGAGRM